MQPTAKGSRRPERGSRKSGHFRAAGEHLAADLPGFPGGSAMDVSLGAAACWTTSSA
jgi:hypothetical protein